MDVMRFEGVESEWDDFVRGHTDWTHFHLYGWRNVMEASLGHETLYLTARLADGKLAGVLPLVRVRSRLFGHFVVSMPFLNYGGPLGSPDAIQSLAARAVEICDESDVDLLEFRSRSELPIELPASHRKVTVVLDLHPGDAEATWSALKSKLRSQVRRPTKEGVRVRFGPSQLDAFYQVFAENMRDLGTPVMGRGVFETMQNEFGDSVQFGCAWLEEIPVAAGCGFVWNGEFEMTWASSLRAHNRIAPNMLLYWRFIERAAENGLHTFNFGRCTPGGGTHRFKSQWGGRDEKLWWYHRLSDEQISTPNPSDGRYSYGPRVWCKLPLSVANRMGPRVSRLIP